MNNLRLRTDISENWAAVNPVLALGEVCFNKTDNKIKIGDGVKTWAQLEYVNIHIDENEPPPPVAVQKMKVVKGAQLIFSDVMPARYRRNNPPRDAYGYPITAYTNIQYFGRDSYPQYCKYHLVLDNGNIIRNTSNGIELIQSNSIDFNLRLRMVLNALVNNGMYVRDGDFMVRVGKVVATPYWVENDT